MTQGSSTSLIHATFFSLLFKAISLTNHASSMAS